jgi:MinD-like ATPase involved in chromosome partitioning or flagellar assembly
MSDCGTIYTFYSYKGGVGRSMCLANVGALLATWGKKVLIVDWDLEAPGIERFFENPSCMAARRRSDTDGVVDLLEAWEQSYATFEPPDDFEEPNYPRWQSCIVRVTSSHFREPLDIITAGRDDGTYESRLQSLNWDRLFDKANVGLFLEHLRKEWSEKYDFVLLDSRTGASDAGGVCSVLLPDILICVFTTTEQSIGGIRRVVDSVRRGREALPLERSKLLVVPLLGRDEGDREYALARHWRQRVADEFSDLFEDWVHRDVAPRNVVNKLKIPYATIWSFGERLPVLEADALEDPGSIGAAYARVAALLSERLDWTAVEKQIPSPSSGQEDPPRAAAKTRRVAPRVAIALFLLVPLLVGAWLWGTRQGTARGAKPLATDETARAGTTVREPVIQRWTNPASVESDLRELDGRNVRLAQSRESLRQFREGFADDNPDWLENIHRDASDVAALAASIVTRAESLLLHAEQPASLDQVQARAASEVQQTRDFEKEVLGRPARKNAGYGPWLAGFRKFLDGNNDEALALFSRAAEAGDYAPAAYSLGRLALLASKRGDAHEHFRAALALDSDYAPARIGLALLHLHGRDVNDARKLLRLAAAQRPLDPQIATLEQQCIAYETRPPLDNVLLPRLFAETQASAAGKQRRFNVAFLLDVPAERESEIRKVEYFFDHASFGDGKRNTAVSPGNGFAVYYDVYGCIPFVAITVYLRDDSWIKLDLPWCESPSWAAR